MDRGTPSSRRRRGLSAPSTSPLNAFPGWFAPASAGRRGPSSGGVRLATPGGRRRSPALTTVRHPPINTTEGRPAYRPAPRLCRPSRRPVRVFDVPGNSGVLKNTSMRDLAAVGGWWSLFPGPPTRLMLASELCHFFQGPVPASDRRPPTDHASTLAPAKVWYGRQVHRARPPVPAPRRTDPWSTLRARERGGVGSGQQAKVRRTQEPQISRWRTSSQHQSRGCFWSVWMRATTGGHRGGLRPRAINRPPWLVAGGDVDRRRHLGQGVSATAVRPTGGPIDQPDVGWRGGTGAKAEAPSGGTCGRSYGRKPAAVKPGLTRRWRVPGGSVRIAEGVGGLDVRRAGGPSGGSPP